VGRAGKVSQAVVIQGSRSWDSCQAEPDPIWRQVIGQQDNDEWLRGQVEKTGMKRDATSWKRE
jgi:hypothetical protein